MGGLLWATCYLWPVMGGLLFVVCYGWPVMGGLLWVACYGWPVMGDLLFVACYGWPVISGLLWVACYLWSVMGDLLWWPVICGLLWWPVICGLLLVACYWWPVMGDLYTLSLYLHLHTDCFVANNIVLRGRVQAHLQEGEKLFCYSSYGVMREWGEQGERADYHVASVEHEEICSPVIGRVLWPCVLAGPST